MSFLSRTPSSRPYNWNLPAATVGIVVGWLLVNGFFLLKNGIVTTGEAEKYICVAQDLVRTGHFESANFTFYSVIIILLSACLKFHLSFGWIIAIQACFSLAATLYFHKTLLLLLRSPKLAFIGTFLLLLNFPYQSFNTFLQTESLFQSISLLLICGLIQQKKYSGRFLLIMLITLLLLSVIRPTGFLYWPVAGIYLFTVALAKSRLALKIAAASAVLFLSLYAVNWAMNSGGELDFMRPFREDHIICGTPTLLYPRQIGSNDSGHSLYPFLTYIVHDFGRFIHLAGLKTLSFWAIFRNYYSLSHNLYLVAYFYPIILMALFSAPSWIRHRPLPFLYVITPVLLTWLSVILTCDDWSNRFFLSISPFIIMLSLPTSSDTSSHNHY
ncbi:MAG TPA: hypothetical protein VK518_22475 [Puia sp.]|nr:hypothetical protein [Puia sp.]